MNSSNKIIFKRGDYKTQEEFYDIIFRQIKILIESDNVFSFHENPNVKGVYALQFGSSSVNDSNTYPVWLDGDEILYVTKYAREKAYAEAKATVSDYEGDDDLWEQLKEGDKKGDA